MPAEPELLDSAADHLTGRRGLVLVIGLALVVVAVGAAGFLNRGGEAPIPPLVAAPTTAAADDLITGIRPVTGLPPSGNAAIAIARTVVGEYCDRIESWRIRVERATADYSEVVLVLTPSGPAYRSVSIRLELTWQRGHYTWTGSRAALLSCP
ncbi:hypothetical protein BH20ACT5_BH20ACT5_23450 [soil metagenome]